MILDILQAVLAVLLSTAILLQARGASVGLAFGGSGDFYRTRRGIEKKLHVATVVLAILFFGTALANSLFNV
ncbi:MAG: preprotein translocase subunit SecG [Patescibacteria group bacterium]